MNKIINLTPHAVNIICNEKTITFEASGEVARCKQSDSTIGKIETENGTIAISATKFGDVEGLPEPKADTYYIVSRLIMQACSDRADLLVPNEIVRDETGRIVGCESLAES